MQWQPWKQLASRRIWSPTARITTGVGFHNLSQTGNFHWANTVMYTKVLWIAMSFSVLGEVETRCEWSKYGNSISSFNWLSSLLGDSCPGCFQPSVLIRRFTRLESTSLMGMYCNCRKEKYAAHTEAEESLLEGESGNYNVTELFLLDLHTTSLHLFALKWSLLPLHSSHWQYFVHNTESAEIQCARNASIYMLLWKDKYPKTQINQAL